MIFVSFFWSLTPILDKICLKHSSINIHGLVQSSFTLIILLFFSKSNFEIFSKLKIKKLHNYFLLQYWLVQLLQYYSFYAILSNFVPIMESIKRATGQFSAVILGKIFFNRKYFKTKKYYRVFLTTGVNFLV